MSAPTATQRALVVANMPAKFWDDHRWRGGSESLREWSRCRSRVLVSGETLADFADLMSDADYYSDPRGFDPDYRGLCASARRARADLIAAGVPAPPRFAMPR